jgi:hypothetical protein
MQLEYFIDKDDVMSRHLASKLTIRLPIMQACNYLLSIGEGRPEGQIQQVTVKLKGFSHLDGGGFT